MRLAERTFRGKYYVKPVGRSKYGWRIHPITGQQQFHLGEDYATGGQKWPLYALEFGVVESVGFDSVNGNNIWIKYPRIDLKVFFGHLDVCYLKTGQWVSDDTVVGSTGTTGRSSGIHLHMGVKRISTNQYFDHSTYDYQKFAVDGVWSEQFMRDLQFYEGTTIDSIISGQHQLRKNIKRVKIGVGGSELVRVIQRKLKIPVNGQLDQFTLKAMQKWLGTYVDGNISPQSSAVRKMQELMNQGVQLWV